MPGPWENYQTTTPEPVEPSPTPAPSPDTPSPPPPPVAAGPAPWQRYASASQAADARTAEFTQTHPQMPAYMADTALPPAYTAPSRDIPAATQRQMANRAPEASLVDGVRYWTGLASLFDGLPGVFGDQAAMRRFNDTSTRVWNSVTGANRDRGVRENSTPVTRLANGRAPNALETVNAIITDPEYRARWLRDEGANMATGAGMFLDQNELHRAEMVRHNFPDSQFRRDPRGFLEFRFTPHDDWNYINAPGVTPQDAVDTGAVLEKFLPAARIGALPRTLLSRVMASGIASAATEYGAQEGARLVGGPGADTGDVAAAGFGGAVGQGAFDIAGGVAPEVLRATRRALGIPEPLRMPLPEPGALMPRPQPRPFADTATRGTPDEISALEAELADLHYRGPLGIRDITDKFNIQRALRDGTDIRLSEGNRVQIERANAKFGEEVADVERRLNEAREPYFSGEPGSRPAPVTAANTPSAGRPGLGRALSQMVREFTEARRLRAAAEAKAPPVTASTVRTAFDEQHIPASRAQVSQDTKARQREDDLIQSGEPTALRFANDQAEAIRKRGEQIATRGAPAISADREEAGQALREELQRQFRQIDDLADETYDRAFEALGGERVLQDNADRLGLHVDERVTYGTGSREDPGYRDSPTGFTVDDFAELPYFKRAMRVITDLRSRIAEGNLTFAAVERSRQRLRGISEEAVGNDAQAVRYARHGFDEWLTEALGRTQTGRITSEATAAEQAASAEARANAARLIEEARAIWGERQRLFSQSGKRDVGGAAIERIRDPKTEITGHQLMNTIFGSGSKVIPTPQAVGALRRIREASLETLSNGRLRAPGAPPTEAARAFAEGGQLPPAMQALREEFWHRVLEPLRARRANSFVPARAVANLLDKAINGEGTAITRMLYTPAEVEQMTRMLQVLKYIERPIGVNTSGTAITAARMLQGSMEGLAHGMTGFAPFLLRRFGALLTGQLESIGKMAAANRAFSRPALDVTFGRSPSAAALGQLPRTTNDDGASPDPNPAPPPPPPDPMAGVSNIRSAASGTITFQADGRWVTLSTIPATAGRQLGVADAIRAWRSGQIAPIAETATEDEAMAAARSYRSAPATVP